VNNKNGITASLLAQSFTVSKRKETMPPQNSVYSTLHKAATPEFVEPWLKTTISIFGWAQIIFFSPILVILLLDLPRPGVLQLLIRWGPGGGEQYEEMISIIYIIWGYFCLKAAHNPFAHELFLDFTVWGDFGHMGIMTAMAVVNEKDRIHLIGDLLAAWIFYAPFVYVWTRAKREYHARR